MGNGGGQTTQDTTTGMSAGAAVGGPIGGAIGGAIGLMAGLSANNKAGLYEQQQEQALAADQAKRDAFTLQQQKLYGPIQQQLTQEAANPTPLNYGANLGQINQLTQQAGQNLNGQMAAHGMTGSGIQGSAMQGLEQGRVGELSKAFNTGMNARTQLGMGLLQQYNPLANAQYQTGALDQQMAFGAREQGINNAAAQSGMAAFGKGLAGVLNGVNLPGQSQPNMNAVNQDNFNTGLNLNGNAQNANDIAMGQQSPGGVFSPPPAPMIPQAGLQMAPQDQSMQSIMQGQGGQVPAESNDLSGLNAFSMGGM